MVWWNKIDDAARYMIYLYVAEGYGDRNYHEIACIEKDRYTCYHSFRDLALVDRVRDDLDRDYSANHNRVYSDYYVSVVAEDRVGNIIAESRKTTLTPLTMSGR